MQFNGRVTKAYMRRTLQSVVDGSMNALRIWGGDWRFVGCDQSSHAGGTWQPSEFYDLCDQLGILVLHDFMLTCTLTVLFPLRLHQLCFLAGYPKASIVILVPDELSGCDRFRIARRVRSDRGWSLRRTIRSADSRAIRRLC